MRSFFRVWPALALLLFLLAQEASANPLHYAQVEDLEYGPVIADNVADPEIPLQEWIVYKGDASPQYLAKSNGGTTVSFIRPDGQAVPQTTVVFDAPTEFDGTNPGLTSFHEFEVVALEDKVGPSIDVGLTDLVFNVKYDENAGTISEDRPDTVNSPNTTGIPPWFSFSGLPLRVRMYYHYGDNVMTFVLVDDTGTALAPISFQGLAPLFENFFGIIEGTKPGVIEVYPFVICNVDCTVTALDWGIAACTTTGGDVDTDGCVRLNVVGNGILEPGETCDDGNVVSGDGCDASGQLEKIGQKCQEAIGKAGERYVKVRLKNLQKCRNLLNKGGALFQDKDKTVPVLDRSECPSEHRTARNVANTRAKARKLVAAKCTDGLIGALANCADTVDEIVSPDGTAGCLIEEHDASVDAMLTTQYGG